MPVGRFALAAALATGAAAGIGIASLGAQDERVVHVTARQFEFEPARIVLKRGEPVRLDFESADRLHGLNVPGLGIRAEITPGKTVSIRLTPQGSPEASPLSATLSAAAAMTRWMAESS